MLDYFQKFYAVEREIGLSLKAVHSDNGGEYMCPFEKYYRKHRIEYEKTDPKTPHQNELEKRMNRTICEKVRSMLSVCKFPKNLLG